MGAGEVRPIRQAVAAVQDADQVDHGILAGNQPGQAYGCCGPKVYTLAELVRYVGEQIGRPRPILVLPEALARLQAGLLELLPNPPLSVDNLDSMDVDSVCAGGEPLPFGIRPVALEAVAPEYLGGRTPRHRFYGYRLKAHRSD